MKALRPLLLFVAALVVLVSALAAAVVLRPAPAGVATRIARCTPRHPCLAIVIDDIGRDPAALDQLLALDADLTFAVLPHAEHTASAVRQLQRKGREIMLHLPMMPHDPDRMTDEPVVLGPDTPISIALDECLQRVVGAVGVNNHMGSALSEDLAALRAVFRRLRRRNLWFVDSRTSGNSRICDAAAEVEVPCLPRDVFLDDPPDPVSIDAGLMLASQRAHQRGWAVAIGHPIPPTIAALRRFLTSRDGVQVVRVSRILTSRGTDVPLTHPSSDI